MKIIRLSLRQDPQNGVMSFQITSRFESLTWKDDQSLLRMDPFEIFIEAQVNSQETILKLSHTIFWGYDSPRLIVKIRRRDRSFHSSIGQREIKITEPIFSHLWPQGPEHLTKTVNLIENYLSTYLP